MMTLKDRDKILILTCHYGAGHLQAANAIQDAIRRLYPTAETVIIDPEAECRKILGMVGHKLFIGGVKKFPSIYHYLYQKTRNPNNLSALLKGMNRLGIDGFLDRIKEIKPTIIVSTDPASSGMVSNLKSRGLINIPVVTVITDYAVHSYWVNPSIDCYIVGSESVRKGLWDMGVDDVRITVTGIPIHSKFSRDYAPLALRKKHGLDETLPIVLITGGGYGLVGNNLSVVNLLETIPFAVQLIVVCGHNEHLYKRFEKEIAGTTHNVILKRYVEDIEELMAVSDCMITKAGGMSISEALSMNLPMVLYKSLGGHEQENTHYLLENDTALLAKNKEDLYVKVSELISDARLRSHLIENMKHIQKRRSATDAAKVIKATLTTQVDYQPVMGNRHSLVN